MATDRPTPSDATQDKVAAAPSSADFGRRQWFSDAQRREVAAGAEPKSGERDPKFLDGVTARKFFTDAQRSESSANETPRTSTPISNDTQH